MATTYVRATFIGVIIGLLAGCGGGGATATTEDAAADPAVAAAAAGQGVITGRVVDVSSDVGIAGAEVSIFVGTEVRRVTATVDDSKTAEDEAGEFIVDALPGGRYRAQVAAAGYATFEASIEIEAADEPTYVALTADGRIPLRRDCAARVIVVQEEAQPIAGVRVYASAPGWKERAAVTGDDGGVALDGLAQGVEYIITIPLQPDADPSVDAYRYRATSHSYICWMGGEPVTMALVPVKTTGTPQQIGGTMSRYGAVVGDYYSTGGSSSFYAMDPAAPLVLVYDRPIEIQPNTVTLHVAPDAVYAGSTEPQDVPIDVEVRAESTVVIVRPRAPLPANVQVFLDGLAVATGQTTPLILSSQWYTFDPTPLALAAITLDNVNKHTGQPGDAKSVRLEFPEAVRGTAIVYGYTLDGVRHELTNPAVVELATGAFAVTDVSGGCTAGVCNGEARHFVISLPGAVSLPDDRPDARNTVDLAIDVRDFDGHRVSARVALPVE